MESFVAWFVLPAVVLALCLGLGLLVQRVAGVELPAGLAVPVGAALAIVLALSGYVAGLHGLLTPLAIVALAVAGVVLALRRGAGLPRPGLAALVWTATYGLYLAPVALSGHWTWLGYNFVNDTSVQLLLAEWLAVNGRAVPPQGFVSTPLDVLRTYLSGGYPLGSHALLAATGELVPIRLEALYQPFIAVFAGIGAMALAVLVRPLAGARWAAFAAFTAMAGNLFYQYALQGNLKEVVTATLLATAAAVAGWSLALLRRAEPSARGGLLVRATVVLALPVAAAVDVLSTAGAPYAGLLVLGWLGLLLVRRLVPGPKPLALAAGLGLTVLLLGTVATLETLISFGQSTSTTYADPIRASELGHLARPLEPRQTAGIWLVGDYRLAPTGLKAALTSLGVWLVLALAVVGVVHAVVRRNVQVLLFCAPLLAIVLLVTPRVSPYADAKTFMLLTPGVVLLGALGAAALARLRAPLGVALGAVVLTGVLASNALAYHRVQLAPTERMAALRDLDERFAGQGLILFNEPEEFAKNFLGATKLNVGAESITPKQTQLRVPQAFAYLYFDLDEQLLEYVEQFPLVVLRRSPAASRPPSDFRLVYRNDYYEAWRRAPGPRVVEHMPLQAVHRAALEPACPEVVAMAGRVAPGEALVAAEPAATVRLDTVVAPRTASWRVHPYRADMVITGGPGEARSSVTVEAPGRYRAWIAGSFGRPVTGFVDGRPIGVAQGVNTIGGWHRIGEVALTAGPHELALSRPGGSLSPGDGFSGELGPLVLERMGPRRMVRVRPEQAAEQLCGREWDWIERLGS